MNPEGAEEEEEQEESRSGARVLGTLEGKVSDCHLLPRPGACAWGDELAWAGRPGEGGYSSEFFTLGSFTTWT